MNEVLLSIKNLCAWYRPDKRVLEDVSLDLYAHEIVGLIGRNGAGKTTLLESISGLRENMQVNEVMFRNRIITFRDRDFKRCRYTVFAEDNGFGYFTFGQYLNYVLKAYGKPAQDMTALVEGFHFVPYMHTLLRDLSTGNRKKAFLITALALQADLLILDEPVNGLDFDSTEFLYQMLKAYKAYGTVLFSSHVLESLTLVADRVLVLDEGKIRQSFGPEEIDANHIRDSLQTVI